MRKEGSWGFGACGRATSCIFFSASSLSCACFFSAWRILCCSRFFSKTCAAVEMLSSAASVRAIFKMESFFRAFLMSFCCERIPL